MDTYPDGTEHTTDGRPADQPAEGSPDQAPEETDPSNQPAGESRYDANGFYVPTDEENAWAERRNAQGTFFVPPRPEAGFQVQRFWLRAAVPEEVTSALIVIPGRLRAEILRPHSFGEFAANNGFLDRIMSRGEIKAFHSAEERAASIHDIPDAPTAEFVARMYGIWRDAQLLPEDEAWQAVTPGLPMRNGKLVSPKRCTEYYQTWNYDKFFTDPTAAKRYLDAVGW